MREGGVSPPARFLMRAKRETALLKGSGYDRQKDAYTPAVEERRNHD